MNIDINKREFSVMSEENISPEKIDVANKRLREMDSKKEVNKLEKFLNTYNLNDIKNEIFTLLDEKTAEKILDELMQQAEMWNKEGKSDIEIEEQLKSDAKKMLNFGK
jgi:chromatin segregation and condensation protein Rec8/ScpA/Scc1 (kleisin family)